MSILQAEVSNQIIVMFLYTEHRSTWMGVTSMRRLVI